MLVDEREHIRELGYRRILKARQNVPKKKTVRNFIPQKINFQEIINWISCVMYPPPMLRNISEDIKSLSSDTTPIREIQKFDYHTQAVERCINFVTEASNKICGHKPRDGYIQATLKPRSVMPDFSKKSDFKCVVDIKKKKNGAALVSSSKVKNQNLWVESRNKFLSGKDYVNLLKTKIACFPTAARCARGSPAKDKYYRAGCPRTETLNHVSQACPRTHGKRIQRHEAVINHIKRACENRGFEVTAEPLYKTQVGNRKPDLLAKKDGKILVIDAQVVGDAVDLERANNRKISYYRDNVELDQQIQAQHGSPDISYLGATLNLRGVWSAKSVFDLVDKFKVLSRTDVPVISTRVLIGTFASFTMFNRSTARATRGKHS
ncbi:Retrovirus-related Pol polyprotein from type-2 retrotransposable element R2DM [Araneus ventricosus]|uniref:Retrovirus-related Pol polyprotein from type-2 retrotransposable element R2DM n=1 Tax=Araneus ventricosus TaxID=182803 RepID=A0A4Y2SGW6_ARAVE|nr:Retrovirus-related Pol polyprotein from type-2 retrotransposable element R2DM [Araneus ventricosus]